VTLRRYVVARRTVPRPSRKPDVTQGAGCYNVDQVRIERHWWNGSHTARGRRDVYIRSDGLSWEVQAQTGGNTGRSKTHPCPSRVSAEILAAAWLGDRRGWRELTPDEPQAHSRQTS
jgi:hypothetical protein